MFSTTFYSFKGGVGRTLALINVAVELAKDGNDVAIIDFDLEAPGLQTFNIFGKNNQPKVGLLEFISEYISSVVDGDPEVPQIHRFMYEATPRSIKFYADSAKTANATISKEKKSAKFSSNKQGRVWLLPARGKNSRAEPTSIDWRKLYQEQDGFLLMEELKARIKTHTGADYLLVDSRTGLSDHSRVCTNQLADALAVIFFPNVQNLRGLEGFMRGIRKSKSVDEEHIRFVASRVPTGDDEAKILEKIIADFESGLRIKTPLLRLHQNTSFELLNQEIFTLTRTENTQLFKDYVALTLEIETMNPVSKRGTYEFFSEQVINQEKNVIEENLQSDEYIRIVRARLIKTAALFWYETEVNLFLAGVYEALGKTRGAASRFEDLELVDAAFYHALVGIASTGFSGDLFEDTKKRLINNLFFHFNQSGFSFKDIDNLTLDGLLNYCYSSDAYTSYLELHSSSLQALPDEITMESPAVGAHFDSAGKILDTAAGHYSLDEKLINGAKIRKEPLEPFLIALLIRWRHRVKSDFFDFSKVEFLILSEIPQRRCKRFISRFLTHEDQFDLHDAFLSAVRLFHLPFFLDEDYELCKPQLETFWQGEIGMVNSETKGFMQSKKLSNQNKFVFFYSSFLALVFNAKEIFQEADGSGKLDTDFLDISPFYSLSAQDSASMRFAKAIVARLANNSDFFSAERVFALEEDLTEFEKDTCVMFCGEKIQSFFSLIELKMVCKEQIIEEYHIVINGSADDLREYMLSFTK